MVRATGVKCLAARRRERGWSRIGNRTVRLSVQTGMRRATAALSVLLLVVVGAACGNDDDPVATGGPPATGEPTDVILRITTGGGFVPYGYDFATVPTIVQRDGTVLVGGAVTMQYPGAALTPVVTGKLAAADLQHLLDAARDAGLDQAELDAGQPGITDNPTTTIVVELDGKQHEHAVYALGFGGAEDAGGGGGDTGLTAEQVAVRTAVQGFVSEVSDKVTAAADEPFVPTGYQVIAQPVDPAAPPPEEPLPNDLDWPFADLTLPSPDQGGCLDVDGARTAPFAELLAKATQITIWHTADGGTFHLSVRATLPGDDACSAKG
jgi:hypothetical protein